MLLGVFFFLSTLLYLRESHLLWARAEVSWHAVTPIVEGAPHRDLVDVVEDDAVPPAEPGRLHVAHVLHQPTVEDQRICLKSTKSTQYIKDMPGIIARERVSCDSISSTTECTFWDLHSAVGLSLFAIKRSRVF